MSLIWNNMLTLNMSCDKQLPGCTSYQVWADLIALLTKYDFLSKLLKSYYEPNVMPPWGPYFWLISCLLLVSTSLKYCADMQISFSLLIWFWLMNYEFIELTHGEHLVLHANFLSSHVRAEISWKPSDDLCVIFSGLELSALQGRQVSHSPAFI